MANHKATITGQTTGSVNEDDTASITGLLTVTDSDPGQGFAAIVNNAPSSYGTWSVDANGNWTYQVDNSNSAVQALGDGKSLTDHFTVSSLDGSAHQTVTITIHGVNDVPTFSGDESGTVTEDTALSTSGTLVVTDKDTGESGTHSATGVASDNGYGHWSVDAAGHWKYNLDNTNATVQALGAGQFITDTFTITSKDGSAGEPITITIYGTNDVAKLTGGTTASVTEDAGTGSMASGSFTITDKDQDQAHTTVETDAASTYGTWSVDADGHWNYQLNNGNSAVQALGAGATLTDSFTVSSLDGSATKIVTVTIHGVNDPASMTGPLTGTVKEDGTLTASGKMTVTDVDTGENHLHVQASTATEYGHWSVSGSATNTWKYVLDDGNPTVQALGAGETLTDTFTISSQDGTAHQTVSITIKGTNDAPDAHAGAFSLDEDTPFSGQLVATDPDIHDTLTYSLASGGQAAHGSVVIHADGSFDYTPGTNYNGSDSFTYKVDDGNGGTSTATVSLTINAVNDAPVAQPDSASGNEDTTIAGQLVATDVEGDTLTYSLADKGEPAHGSVTVNPDGSYTYAPAHDYNGSDSFTYQVDDGHGGTATATISLTINPVEDAPVAQAATASGDEDTTITGQLVATDVDGDALTYSLADKGEATHGEVTINPDGSYTYTPGQDYNGSDSFTYQVDDGHGGTATATVSLTVNPVNDAPTPPVDTDGGDGNNNIYAGATDGTTVGITVHSTDVDGDALTYALTDTAGGKFTIDSSTGVISVATGAVIPEGDYTVKAVANDGHVNSAEQSFTIHAGPLVVDPSGANGAFTTIQDAVNAAEGLHGPVRIVVNTGDYHEQVQVDGHNLDGLTIEAAPGATVNVMPPSTPWESTANSPTSGRDYDGLITVDSANNVTIRGLTVDGQEQGGSAHLVGSNDPSMAGIVYVNTTGGLIDGVTVTGIREDDANFGDQRNVGIVVANANPGSTGTPSDTDAASLGSIEIKDSTVDNFQKAGIQVSFAEVDIHGNTVTGIGSTDWTAQNGIQVSGSTGDVHDNQVSGIGYTGDYWAASDILTFENNGLHIHDNAVTATPGDSTIGIAAEDSVGTTITDNTVDGAQFPIDVEDYPTADGWPDPLGGGTYDLSSNHLLNTNGEGAYFQADAASTDAFHVTGTDQADTIITGAASDTIDGGAGDDLIDGGAGADAMHGGAGNDTFQVDNAGDAASEDANQGTADTVNSSVNFTLADNVENLNLEEGKASQSIDFEDYAAGKIIDGENGWKVADGSVTQSVAASGDPSHGNVFVIANDPASGAFGGPYTPELSVKVGETTAGADTDHMTYSLDFKPVNGVADGSRVEIDFGNADGTDRENFMVLEYTATGIRLAVNEPTTNGDDWTNNNFDFGTGNRTLVDGLDPTQWHNIQLTLVANPGPNNDVIEVYVDGKLAGTTTTFENYRDFTDPGAGSDHNANVEANLIDRLIFRVGDANDPTAADGDGGNRQGFMIDNINTSAGAPIVGIGNGDDNVINGNSADNQLSGLGGNDTLNGGIGFDTLTGGEGNDTIDGGAGTDTAAFKGDLGDHGVQFSGGTITVTDTVGSEGTDTLHSVESLKFDDTTVLIVDQSNPDGYTTIQSAVDAAQSIDGPVTIMVRPGTYTEQVVVDGRDDLTITNSGEPGTVTVAAPATLVQTATGSGGAAENGIITVNNADNVTVHGITVDGQLHGAAVTGSNAQLVGIVYAQSSGAVDDVNVTGTREADEHDPVSDTQQVSGNQRGTGIYVYNTDPTPGALVPDSGDALNAFALTNSTIDGFQKNGVTIRNADVYIHGNTITGQDVVSTNQAQNGIQVSGSTGSIDDNTISGIDRNVTTDDYSPAGILTFDNRDLSIINNTITGLPGGNMLIGIYADGSVGAVTTGNDVEQTQYPIYVTNPTGGGTDIDFSGSVFAADGDPNVFFDAGADNTVALTVTGSDGTDELHGGAAADTLNGNGGNDLLEGRGDDDTINAGSGSDTVIYNVGDGHDTVDGGGDTDTLQVNNGATTGTIFDIDGTAGADPVVVKVDGSDAVSASSVEEIELNLGSGGDTVHIGSLDGTSVAISTITVHGGNGGDTIDASGIDGAHAVGVSFDGGGGDDAFTGGAGDDTFTGGAGHDTAAYGGTLDDLHFTFNGTGANQTLTVSSAAGGSDTLSGVEQLNVGLEHVLIVGAGGYATIQAAVNAAGPGDTILVGPGTYHENVNVTQSVTIMGSGADTVIEGSFRSANGIPDGTSVAEWLQSAPSYVDAADKGITVSADGVTLQNLTITGFNTGIELGSNTGLTVKDVDISETVDGIRKGTGAAVANFDLEGGSITNSYHGVAIYAATNGAGDFSGVTINGTHFENLTEKGIYAEQMSNAVIDGVSMENVGEFGTGPAFGIVGHNGAGIDINLKYEGYSNIEIKNFDLQDTGHSYGTDATADNSGGAILVKARDDGGYSSPSATLTGVSIHDGTIDGTGVGIRTGEPAKGNVEPALTINNVAISNADISQYDNQTHSVTDVTLTGHDDTAVAAAGSIGEFDFHGGAGNDHITGGGGNDKLMSEADNDTLNGGGGDDTITGGTGDDSITGGGGHDTAKFSGDISDYTITWDGETATVHDNNTADGDDGTDTIVGVGQLQFADHTAILVGHGADAEYATVQSGVNASNNGDVVLVSHGTYTENVTVDGKSITIEGAGRAGADDTINTVLDGNIAVSGTVEGAVKVADMIIDATNSQAGIDVTAGSSDGKGSIAVDNVLVENGEANGFSYILTGNGSNPQNPDTVGSISITNSEFFNNATTHTGAGGEGDILVYGYDGDLTIDQVDIHDPTANSDRAIQLTGVGTGSDTEYVGPYRQGGTVQLSNITIDGAYNKEGIGVQHFLGFDSFTTSDVAFTDAAAAFGLIHLDSVGGTVHADGVTGTNEYDANHISLLSQDQSTDDTFYGTGGTDAFFDFGGADQIFGNGGDDVVVIASPLVHPAGETIDGGDGTDTILFTDSSSGGVLGLDGVTHVENVIIGDVTGATTGTQSLSVLGGSLLTDVTITGNNGDNTLTGGAGNDHLIGNGGNDTLDGGGGSNDLYGGKGDDLYFVHSGNDFVHENPNQGTDTVDSTVNYALPDNVENLILDAAAGDINGTGNTLANTITGNDGANHIDGAGGADVLSGGNGDDTMTGGLGIDHLDGGGGNDHLSGGSGADVLHGGAGDDTMTGGAGPDAFQFDSFVDGHDTIVDFDAENDNLSFKASLDIDHNGIIDDLYNAIASIDDTTVGGDVVVNFKDGGSITFQGIGTATDHGTDIATLVSDPSQIITHA